MYEINNKYYFLADFYFWEVALDVDKYIFPWQTCFISGVRLTLSWIRVNTVFKMLEFFSIVVEAISSTLFVKEHLKLAITTIKIYRYYPNTSELACCACISQNVLYFSVLLPIHFLILQTVMSTQSDCFLFVIVNIDFQCTCWDSF